MILRPVAFGRPRHRCCYARARMDDPQSDLVDDPWNAALREAARKFIMEKWQGLSACPICKESNWEVSDLFESGPIRTAHGPLINPGTGAIRVYTFFPVFCRTCGYTILFDSNALDLDVAQSGMGKQEEN